MTTKLVLRLLTATRQLLGWTETQGEARGDGCLHVPEVTLRVELAGVPAELSIHWCELNIEARSPIAMGFVGVGQRVRLRTPPMVIGPPAHDLPPVTVRQPIRLEVPAGTLRA